MRNMATDRRRRTMRPDFALCAPTLVGAPDLRALLKNSLRRPPAAPTPYPPTLPERLPPAAYPLPPYPFSRQATLPYPPNSRNPGSVRLGHGRA